MDIFLILFVCDKYNLFMCQNILNLENFEKFKKNTSTFLNRITKIQHKVKKGLNFQMSIPLDLKLSWRL
ncbi:hypothetical protein BpHYR1_017816 [Brachionus plicatilis]|uniref:Uncharacterized protein n=1 Tax=Brachionus plicatilis TaxID=10195 RepID=A0A3M7RMF5_BRAPC|nr:hypothetical protein BpHYR1_017816 [Brachionus plicatilis]